MGEGGFWLGTGTGGTTGGERGAERTVFHSRWEESRRKLELRELKETKEGKVS